MAGKERKEKRWQKEGVIFLVYKNGKILVEQRPDEDSGFGGYKIIPGGKLIQGESVEGALVRESEEELGIIPLTFVYLDSFEHVTLHNNHYLSHAFLITEYEGQVRNIEPEKGVHEWITLSEAEKELKLGASKLVLYKAKEAIFQERLGD